MDTIPNAEAPPVTLMTAVEVARLLRVSTKSVYRLVAVGEIRPSRVGQQLRFRPGDVEEYLDRSRGAAP